MTTSTATLALRRLVRLSLSRPLSLSTSASSTILKSTISASSQCITTASFSTQPDTNDVNPGDFVQGATAADLENDPRSQEYFSSNFPDQFGSGEKDQDIYSLVDDVSNLNEEGHDEEEEEKKIDIMAQQCDLSMNIRPLIAYKRTEEGSRKCRTMRETTDMRPGIIYGSDPTKDIRSRDPSSKILIKTPWNFIQRELDRFTYHNFESRVYDLTLFENEDDEEGTVHRVMPRDVQFHPIYNKIYCCNYLRYFPGKPINIPIVYINGEESPAIKRGGFVAPFNRHVSCVVEDGVKIPEAIEMDFTGAKLKDVLRRDRLIFPDGVSPSHKVKEDFLIGTVFGRRADIGADDSEGNEE